MKSIISFVLIIMFLTTIVSVYGQSEFKENKGEFKEYKGTFIEFRYPVEWESGMTEGVFTEGFSIPKDKKISFSIPDSIRGSFTVQIEDSDKKNLEELLQEVIEYYTDPDMQYLLEIENDIFRIDDITLSNEPAKKIFVYQKKLFTIDKFQDIKILEVVSLHNNQKYSLVYNDSPPPFFTKQLLSKNIDKIIQSFKFTQN